MKSTEFYRKAAGVADRGGFDIVVLNHVPAEPGIIDSGTMICRYPHDGGRVEGCPFMVFMVLCDQDGRMWLESGSYDLSKDDAWKIFEARRIK